MTKPIAEQIAETGMDVGCFIGRPARDFRMLDLDVPADIPSCAILRRDDDIEDDGHPLHLGAFSAPTGYHWHYYADCVDDCYCDEIGDCCCDEIGDSHGETAT